MHVLLGWLRVYWLYYFSDIGDLPREGNKLGKVAASALRAWPRAVGCSVAAKTWPQTLCGPLGKGTEGKWERSPLGERWAPENQTLWMGKKTPKKTPRVTKTNRLPSCKGRGSLCSSQFYSSICKKASADTDKEPVMLYSEKSFIQWIESRQSPCLSPQLLLCPTLIIQQELHCWIAVWDSEEISLLAVLSKNSSPSWFWCEGNIFGLGEVQLLLTDTFMNCV